MARRGNRPRAEKQDDAEEATVPKEQMKRKASDADQPGVVESVELAAEETPRKKKKKMKIAEAEVDADAAVEGETPSTTADAPVPKKKTKKKKLAEEEPGEEAPEEEDGEESIKTVFVRGLPWSVDADTLKKDFGECGAIVDLELQTDRVTGKPKGTAFITYKKEAGVLAALAYDGTDYGGRWLEVRRESAKGKGKGGKDGSKGKAMDHTRELEVFIRGLGPNTKEKALTKEFSKCGEIERLKMDIDIGDGCKCKGYAWITFTTQEGMDKALERHGTEYKEFKITVEKSGQHRAAGKGTAKGAPGSELGVEVFVRGLPGNADEAVVRHDFRECGDICKINMPCNGDGTCKGYAWVTFKTDEGAAKAIKFNGDDYAGSKLLVEIAGQHKARDQKGKGKGKAAAGPKPAGCTSVVVKKLAYEATEGDLAKIFAKCGTGPIDMKILTNWDTGKSKGIAFVDFDSEEAVDQAMKLSGSMIKGIAFFMDYAKPREPKVE